MLNDFNDHLESILVLDADYFYDHLLDLSKARTPKTEEDFRTPQNFVDGCQSSLWLWSNFENDKWHFDIISDAHMVQGLGKILCDTYSGCSAKEILEIKFKDFQPMTKMLTTQRQRGFQSVINNIHQRVK